MREIVSYVVRIYRRDGDAFAGLVEQVHNGRTASFATLAELMALLSGRRAFARRPAQAGGIRDAACDDGNPSH